MGNRPPQSTSGRRWPRDVRDLFRLTRRSNGAAVDCNDFSEQPRLNRLDGQGHVTGQRSGSNGRKSWRDKLNSCPDLQGAAAARGSNQQQHQQQHQPQNSTMQPDLQPPTKLNYKIYRSYGWVNRIIIIIYAVCRIIDAVLWLNRTSASNHVVKVVYFPKMRSPYPKYSCHTSYA